MNDLSENQASDTVAPIEREQWRLKLTFAPVGGGICYHLVAFFVCVDKKPR